MTENEHPVIIYTDGACKGNPGPGGWAAILQFKGKERELVGGEPETTNNRMEMTAVIEALTALKKPSRVEINTDSQYIVNGMREWLSGWKKRNFRNSSGKSIKNRDLWEKLDCLAQQHDVDWNWVRGHNNNEGNERADCLAQESATKFNIK